MSDQAALREEVAQAILDRLCPTNCGYRISSGSMWTEADGSIHSRHQQGGPCGIHVGLANAAAAAVLPVLQRRETALRADAWQEGFDAGENMAHLYGHVDHWEGYPVNPYRPVLPTQGDTE